VAALGAYSRTASLATVRQRFFALLNFIKAIFIWWNGATPGILFTIGHNATLVGSDEYGNRYFEARNNRESYDARKRRYVLYRGYAEPSKVPSDWHGWLHYTFDEPPTKVPLKRQSWETDHRPNLTGTVYAWSPKGALVSGGKRAASTGDYQAWTPGDSN
jgi:NADH:ubiquinone oxidoreductase subunit